MKYFITGVCVMAAVILAVFFCNSYIDKTVDMLLESLDSSMAAADLGDWEASQANADKFADIWNSRVTYLTIFMAHGQLDPINAAVSRYAELVQQRDYVQSKSEGVWLKAMLEHLVDMDKVTIGNIF